VTGNAVSANALTVRQFGTGNVFSTQTTTGATALFVGANGNVGIGTTNPSSRLHVQGGDIYASSNINGTAGNTAWRLQPQYNSSSPFNDHFRITNGWDPIAGTGQVNYAGVGINLNSYQGGSQIEFYTSATNNAVPTERMRITQAGNVGIGTASPDTTLDVNGILTTRSDIYTTPAATTLYSNTFSFRFNDSTASTTGNPLVKIDSSGRNSGSNQILQMGLDGTAFNKTSYLDTATSGVSAVVPLAFRISGSEKMRVHTDGNVGIGTANPTYKLQVFQNFALSGSTVINNMTNSGTASNIARSDWLTVAQTNPYTAITSYNFAGAGETYQYLPLYLQGNPTIFTAGNVGIGTANPGHPLHILFNGGDPMRLETTSAIGFTTLRYLTPTTTFYAGTGGASTGNTLYRDRFVVANGSSQGVYLTNGGTSWSSTSDERAKTILEPISNALVDIDALRTVFYTLNNDPQNIKRAGVIAQDVLKVFPEAVDVPADPESMMGVSYTSLIPLALAAIKELSAENTALKARLDSLEARLAAADL
jgi:hypothetical protein